MDLPIVLPATNYSQANQCNNWMVKQKYTTYIHNYKENTLLYQTIREDSLCSLEEPKAVWMV